MPYTDISRRRACSAAHYAANADVYKRRARAHTIRMRSIVREWLLAFLLENPCVDCGEADPIVLEFDHRPGVDKAFNLGVAVQRNYSLARVKAEVAKCDVRCANCHRRVTYDRAGYTHRSNPALATT